MKIDDELFETFFDTLKDALVDEAIISWKEAEYYDAEIRAVAVRLAGLIDDSLERLRR